MSIEGSISVNFLGKRFLILLIVIFEVLILDFPTFGIDGKSNLATLRGLKGIGVLVEKLPKEIEAEGLNYDQLRMEVELSLKKAGIKVLSNEECLRTPGEPYLYINLNVNISKTESDIYPYTIDVMLIQKVSLIREPDLITYGITWSIGGVGSISKRLVGNLRKTVDEGVQRFIKAYLAENLK